MPERAVKTRPGPRPCEEEMARHWRSQHTKFDQDTVNSIAALVLSCSHLCSASFIVRPQYYRPRVATGDAN
jgi:hypothetical protein